MRRFFLLSLFLAPLSVHAQNAPAEILQAMPTAQAVGTGTKTYLLMDIFTAVLFAPDGQWRPDAPTALRLTYHRHLSGKLIADRSIDEMRSEGFTDADRLEDWRGKMRAIFPDVDDGTVLTGISNGHGPTTFYEDGRRVGAVDDPAFGAKFFGIWLAENSSDPALRAGLLGQKN